MESRAALRGEKVGVSVAFQTGAERSILMGRIVQEWPELLNIWSACLTPDNRVVIAGTDQGAVHFLTFESTKEALRP